MKVIDASVAVKWFLSDDEGYREEALTLFKQIGVGDVKVVQPIHWQAEVIAVLTRVRPEIASEAIILLDALEFPVMDNLDVYQLASQLSQALNHHLFDTLYHAVAILAKASFVTDDRKYYGKARSRGNIQLLG